MAVDRFANAPLAVFGLVGVIPSICFAAAFPHRSDYLGHFAAGYGGTLSLLAVILASAVQRLSSSQLRFRAVIVAFTSILIGAGIEATIFNIAQFDPIDFFNQSLGAPFAALALLACRPSTPLATSFIGSCLAISVLFLGAGFYFAFS